MHGSRSAVAAVNGDNQGDKDKPREDVEKTKMVDDKNRNKTSLAAGKNPRNVRF